MSISGRLIIEQLKSKIIFSIFFSILPLLHDSSGISDWHKRQEVNVWWDEGEGVHNATTAIRRYPVAPVAAGVQRGPTSYRDWHTAHVVWAA